MSVVSVTELIEAVTVIPDPSGTPFKENLTEIGGNAIDTGTGASGSGTQRVALSTDSTVGVTGTVNENLAQVAGNPVNTGVGASDTGTQRVALTTDSQVIPANITTKFRESFETFTPGVVWDASLAASDIVQIDGNTAGASYLVISKDPLTANTESTITTIQTFTPPIETAVGLSASQRVLGQEIYYELISDESPLPPTADIAISSISQSTTTLTVTTATAHNLQAGMRIGIKGITSDSRLNYPSVVVSAIVSTTSFTVTAGPAGTIASLTVGPYNNQGYVYYRSAMAQAVNGISEAFESATATAASIYVRGSGGDLLPTGTVNGNQTVTVGTTASVQPVNAAYAYAFQPTNEYKYVLQADKLQASDVTVDSTTASSNRVIRTQIIPNTSMEYKLRFRVVNVASLTVPSAKIVTASKAGSTTATITTASAHGLTTGDYVVIYGIRNGTDFIPITTPTVIASTPTSTTFTIVYGGTSATVTSFGGFVARVNGANVPAGFAGTGSGAALQTAAVAGGQLTLTSSGNFAVSVGDYVNVYGCRDHVSGADLLVDGTYKVVSVVTTTAVLIPIGSTVLPSSFGSTSCGGAVIKRTDLRLSYTRIFDYTRERVEILPRPSADQGSSLSVYMTGGTLGSGTISTASLAANTIVNDITSAAITTTSTSAAITPTAGALSHEFNVIVTAVSGTNPTLDVTVQESDDSGTNWYDVYQFPRIAATGQYRSPLITLTGNRVRYVRTVGGTSPSFTMSLNRQQSQTSNPVQRQFVDRNMNPTVLNAVTTATGFCDGCVDWSIWMSSFGAFSVAPVLVFEGSPDNATWMQIGPDITPVASTPQLIQASNAQARFIRMRVKTAGTGASIASITFKGVGK